MFSLDELLMTLRIILKQQSIFGRHLFYVYITRAVPRIFCLRGQTLHTLTGVSRIQTGFLVGRFCFLPYTESCLKDRLFIKEKKNHTDAFRLKVS